MGAKGCRAGIITLYGINHLTARGRKRVANWLRRQAQHIENHGDNYAGLVRARLTWN